MHDQAGICYFICSILHGVVILNAGCLYNSFHLIWMGRSRLHIIGKLLCLSPFHLDPLQTANQKISMAFFICFFNFCGSIHPQHWKYVHRILLTIQLNGNSCIFIIFFKLLFYCLRSFFFAHSLNVYSVNRSICPDFVILDDQTEDSICSGK